MIWTNDPTRLMLVASLAMSYGLVCLAPYLRTRRKREAARQNLTVREMTIRLLQAGLRLAEMEGR